MVARIGMSGFAGVPAAPGRGVSGLSGSGTRAVGGRHALATDRRACAAPGVHAPAVRAGGSVVGPRLALLATQDGGGREKGEESDWVAGSHARPYRQGLLASSLIGQFSCRTDRTSSSPPPRSRDLRSSPCAFLAGSAQLMSTETAAPWQLTSCHQRPIIAPSSDTQPDTNGPLAAEMQRCHDTCKQLLTSANSY